MKVVIDLDDKSQAGWALAEIGQQIEEGINRGIGFPVDWHLEGEEN
ncbi:hypothetical protein LCGC14_0926660 [marine sediment metagenome]|uniref:Uncharacterized protein n=1 Tax=marine sediment metagenome TaxID=412755 RepID=A0A0F9NU09_9ZZZZ